MRIPIAATALMFLSLTAAASEAKISMAQARATALARVPGTIAGAELEREGGKLLYSFDIKSPKVSGVMEVHVDAVTGAVLSVEHENAAKEAKEKAKDAKEKQKH
jgi:uncharacterized membrane protein YkoI